MPVSWFSSSARRDSHREQHFIGTWAVEADPAPLPVAKVDKFPLRVVVVLNRYFAAPTPSRRSEADEHSFSAPTLQSNRENVVKPSDGPLLNALEKLRRLVKDEPEILDAVHNLTRVRGSPGSLACCVIHYSILQYLTRGHAWEPDVREQMEVRKGHHKEDGKSRQIDEETATWLVRVCAVLVRSTFVVFCDALGVLWVRAGTTGRPVATQAPGQTRHPGHSRGATGGAGQSELADQ
jgi:hypothetical protein